jgi:hypothetical protein
MSGPNLTPGSSQRTTASADAVMKGHAFYDEHSHAQRKADSLAVPQGAEPAAVADFGAAQGRNSLEPMRLTVEKLRRRTTVSTPRYWSSTLTYPRTTSARSLPWSRPQPRVTCVA